MNTDRIEQLEKFMIESPEDPFLIYALALEIQDMQPNKAKLLFDDLINRFPDYSATYYQAAALLISMGQQTEAKSVFEKGIEILTKQANIKALAELKNAYQNFLFDSEDLVP